VDPVEANRRLWNEWARRHYTSEYYGVDSFRQGSTSLHEVELTELGGMVAGKSLLHLQCHFGLDTLSWARLGAQVTGVDLADEAISLAQTLAKELNIPAEFVCANLYDLPEILQGRYDIVYTSYGVLCWLPDVREWARIVARYLRPGGTFYMVEFHPLLNALDEAADRLTGSYFGTDPVRYTATASYACPHPEAVLESWEWTHGLGEVVTMLLEAGLYLEFLHEFSYTVENYWAEAFEEGAPGKYHLRGRPNSIPLMFSIRAAKPGPLPSG